LDTSTPLDKNARCASGLCRTIDNKCGCDDVNDCLSSEVCHSDNKCYSTGLSIDDDQDCAANDGTALNDRCASGICRTSDNKCGCDDDTDCLSSEVCHSDNKCYTSGLSYEDDQDCSVDDGTALNSRCATGFCRTSDNKCGCDDIDDCSSSEVCHTDNKCYVSGLYGQDCSVDDGTALNARCLSNKCRSSDTLCGCTIDDHCSSGEVCHTDNKCYSSGLSIGQDCAADNGDALNSRCASGICRSSDKKCVECLVTNDCSSTEVCHSDSKCYSSGLGYGQSCAADNGGAVNARCATGICSTFYYGILCGCTNNSHCSYDKVCKTSTNACVPQEYRLSADCNLCNNHQNAEGTTSDVSLKVKRGGIEVYSVGSMNMKPHTDGGGCPDHTFRLDYRGEPDEYEIRIHGADELGVNYFTLHDATNDGEIRRWGNNRKEFSYSDGGEEGWCLSTEGRSNCWEYCSIGAGFANLGVKLYKNGSDSRIKFGGGSKCGGNQVCSSGECNRGGGACNWPTMCCAPVSTVLCLVLYVLYT